MRSIGLAVAMVLALTPVAEARFDPGTVNEEVLAAMADRHMGKLFDRLHLTPEQRSKLEAIRKKYGESTREAHKKLFDKRRALYGVVRRVDATREQAIALQREVDALQGQLAEARLTAWFEGRALLTHDQLEMLEQLPPGKPFPRRSWAPKASRSPGPNK
jgi:Spy/CpxP family protein refolding chaperone